MAENTETLLEFPCEFPLKAMGKKSDSFCSMVVAVVKKHLTDPEALTISNTCSSGDKYVSVTVTFCAHSKPQLDAIYMELKSNKEVLMLL